MVASKPVEFRKGMDSPAALVMQALSCDPFTGDVFIFPFEAIGPLETVCLGRVWAMPGHQAARERRVHLVAGTRRGGHAERGAATSFVHRHGLKPDWRPHGADAGRIKRRAGPRKRSETPARFGTLPSWRPASPPCRASPIP